MGDDPTESEYAHWPWQRCPGTCALPNGFRATCDLRRNHKRPHFAERGLGADVQWDEQFTNLERRRR